MTTTPRNAQSPRQAARWHLFNVGPIAHGMRAWIDPTFWPSVRAQRDARNGRGDQR